MADTTPESEFPWQYRNAPSEVIPLPELNIEFLASYLSLEGHEHPIAEPWLLRGQLLRCLVDIQDYIVCNAFRFDPAAADTAMYRDRTFSRRGPNMVQYFPALEELEPYLQSLRELIRIARQNEGLADILVPPEHWIGSVAHHTADLYRQELERVVQNFGFDYLRSSARHVTEGQSVDTMRVNFAIYHGYQGPAWYSHETAAAEFREMFRFDQVREQSEEQERQRRRLEGEQLMNTVTEDCTVPPEENCPLCYESYDVDHIAVKTKVCRHVFGKICLGNWLNTLGAQTSCPMCRQILAN